MLSRRQNSWQREEKRRALSRVIQSTRLTNSHTTLCCINSLQSHQFAWASTIRNKRQIDDTGSTI